MMIFAAEFQDIFSRMAETESHRDRHMQPGEPKWLYAMRHEDDACVARWEDDGEQTWEDSSNVKAPADGFAEIAKCLSVAPETVTLGVIRARYLCSRLRAGT